MSDREPRRARDKQEQGSAGVQVALLSEKSELAASKW